MKKLVNIIFMASLIVALASCKEDDPGVDLKLKDANIEVAVDATVTVAIESGNGGYSATPTPAGKVDVTITGGNTVSIKGLEEGEATIAVKDDKGKTASIKVTVVSKHTIPSAAQFVWNGVKTDLEIANNWGLTIYSNRLAVTNLADKKQYILSWTGDLSKGEKTGGKLEGIEEEPVTLSSIEVVNDENNTYYIVFEAGTKTGNIYFTN